MKLKALHLFLILLASLIFCSCLGHLSVEGMSGSRRNGDTVKSSVSDSIKDSVSDSIKDSVKDSATSSCISGIISGGNKTPPQANINGDTYSSDSSSDVSSDTALSNTAYRAHLLLQAIQARLIRHQHHNQ